MSIYLFVLILYFSAFRVSALAFIPTSLITNRLNAWMKIVFACFSQLDDWVLCRVRLKGNIPTRAYEIQDAHRAQLESYPPKIEEALPTPAYTSNNNNADMIRDCLNKDCRLLASILSGQALPPIHTVSTLGCQGSNNGNSSTSIVFEDGTADKVNSPLTFSSLDTYFNPLKRKPNEENKYENLFPSNKTLNCDNRDQVLSFSKALLNNDINYYGQCQEGICTNPSDPSIDFQEVHELPFTSKY